MKWTFPVDGGVLAVEVPGDWRSACDESAISFSARSEQAAFTVTLYERDEVDAAVVDRINATTRPFGEPISGKRVRHVPSGTGFSREFRKKEVDVERYWIAHFLFLTDVTIIGSVNSTADQMVEHRTCFESILSSVEFRKKEPNQVPEPRPASGRWLIQNVRRQ